MNIWFMNLEEIKRYVINNKITDVVVLRLLEIYMDKKENDVEIHSELAEALSEIEELKATLISIQNTIKEVI